MQTRIFGKLIWKYLNINQDFKDFQPPWKLWNLQLKAKKKKCLPIAKSSKAGCQIQDWQLNTHEEPAFLLPNFSLPSPPIWALNTQKRKSKKVQALKAP